MIKKIIIFIINFFLVICIFLLSSLQIFSNTIFNKQYIIGLLEKNNYYEKIYYSIEDGFKNYIMQSGLDESILDNLYDKEKVNEDINMVISAVYDGTSVNVDTESIVQKLDNRINSILEQNNRIPESSEIEEIKIFEDAIATTYVDEITYSVEYIKEISNVFTKIQLLLPNIKIILIGVIVILLALIIAISRNVLKIVNTIGIMILTVGIIDIAIKLLIKDRVHNILILNSAFSMNIIDLINSIINSFFSLGIIAISVGAVLIILSSFAKKKNV